MKGTKRGIEPAVKHKMRISRSVYKVSRTHPSSGGHRWGTCRGAELIIRGRGVGGLLIRVSIIVVVRSVIAGLVITNCLQPVKKGG